MKYLENTTIGLMLFLGALHLNRIYGNGIAGFVALMALTFMGIMIVLIANHGE